MREKEAMQVFNELSRSLKVDIIQLMGMKMPSAEVAETQGGKIFFVGGKRS